MKMTNQNLQVIAQGLGGIANMPLKATCAFKVRLLIKKITSHTEAYDEARKDLMSRLAAKDENGEYVVDNNQLTFSSKENEKAFRAEVEELLNQEIDVDIVKLTASDFGDTEIAPNILMALDMILED